MKILVISNTHFNHKNIINYSNRPFKTVEKMNEILIKNWNAKVRKEDIVIHLGDFALGNEEEIRNIKNELNGTIILLKGNHDNTITKKVGFLITDILEVENLIFTHFPLSKEEFCKNRFSTKITNFSRRKLCRKSRKNKLCKVL